MIQDRKKLVSKALNAALKMRRTAAQKLWEPVCIYDFVEERGLKVQFVDIHNADKPQPNRF